MSLVSFNAVKNFFFFHFQLERDTPMCSFLCVYLVWDFLSLLYLWVYSFPQIWGEKTSHYFFHCNLFYSCLSSFFQLHISLPVTLTAKGTSVLFLWRCINTSFWTQAPWNLILKVQPPTLCPALLPDNEGSCLFFHCYSTTLGRHFSLPLTSSSAPTFPGKGQKKSCGWGGSQARMKGCGQVGK